VRKVKEQERGRKGVMVCVHPGSSQVGGREQRKDGTMMGEQVGNERE